MKNITAKSSLLDLRRHLTYCCEVYGDILHIFRNVGTLRGRVTQRDARQEVGTSWQALERQQEIG